MVINIYHKRSSNSKEHRNLEATPIGWEPAARESFPLSQYSLAGELGIQWGAKETKIVATSRDILVKGNAVNPTDNCSGEK